MLCEARGEKEKLKLIGKAVARNLRKTCIPPSLAGHWPSAVETNRDTTMFARQKTRQHTNVKKASKMALYT